MQKGGYFVIISIIALFALASLTSAGITDWFGKITGKATSQDTNASITLLGINPVTIEVLNSTLTGATVDPSENNVKNIEFKVRVTDPDGVSDINVTSVSANFTRSGEGVRANNSCNDLSQDTTLSKNFSCTIGMFYFDESAAWTITVRATDVGNTTFVQNNSMSFTYGSLQAIVLSPNQITWGNTAPGSVNQTSNNDPTLINNTGNFNFTGINVTAINLYGTTNTTAFIGVGNVTIGNNTGSSAECDTSVSVNNATTMMNGTGIQIKQTILTRGNHSVNNGQTGQEQLYYCFNTIPSNLPSQTYSTSGGGAWTVRVIT